MALKTRWLAVALGSLLVGASPFFLPFGSPYLPAGQEIKTKEELSELRRLYLLEPEVVAYRLVSMLPKDSHRVPSFEASSDRVLELLDEISERIEGVPFAEGNLEMAQLVDSVRYDYYRNPYAFSSLRVEHLDRTSRLADGTPFLRGSKTLLRLLNHERRNYFGKPSDYDELRLGQLNEIAVKSSSLPFLRGNSDLMAQLKYNEMKYEENPAAFSSERLLELNMIAQRVTGEAFLRQKDTTLLLVLIGGAILLVFGAGYVVLLRRRRRRRRHHTPRESAGMTVHRACLLLGVEPDCSAQDLTRAYRAVQKQYHPDLLATMGPEFRQLAEVKTREINDAYELLKKRVQASAT